MEEKKWKQLVVVIYLLMLVASSQCECADKLTVWLIINGRYNNGRMIIFEWKISKQQNKNNEKKKEKKKGKNNERENKHQELKIILT